MASIIKTSINLNLIPKDKIIDGKKGKYLPITITINDEVKAPKVYLGNVKVVWSNGTNVDAAPRTDQAGGPPPPQRQQAQPVDDLPF